MGISEQTFYRCKEVYGGLCVGEVWRVKQLEDENRKLKQLVADLSLDKHILQDVLSKKAGRLTDISVLSDCRRQRSKLKSVRRQIIRHNSRRRLAECGPRQGVDVRRRTCGAASADVRWSVA